MPRRARVASYPQLAYFLPFAFPSCQMVKNGCQINALLITLSATPPVTDVVSDLGESMWVTGATHSCGRASRPGPTRYSLLPWFAGGTRFVGRSRKALRPWLLSPFARPWPLRHWFINQTGCGLAWPRMATHLPIRTISLANQYLRGLSWPRLAFGGHPYRSRPCSASDCRPPMASNGLPWPATGPHRLHRCEGPKKIPGSTPLCSHSSRRVL